LVLRANVGTGALLAVMTWLASLGFTTPGVAFLIAVGALAVYARAMRER
jgi:membrane protein implicated in regulation of membrane protease activity